MNEYRQETIRMIRMHGGRLDEKTDEEIERLYKTYSNETASAGWLIMHNEAGIKSFYEWAITAPCDRI